MAKYHFGTKSNRLLADCHPGLKRVMHRAISMTPFDFTIVCVLRTAEAQNEAFANGFSKKTWPNSMHNGVAPHFGESLAVDFAPWINSTIPWKDTGSFYQLVGVIKAAAVVEEVEIRCGADWDNDGLTRDQTFMDLGHVELA